MHPSLPFLISAALLASSATVASANQPEPGLWEITADMSVPSAPGFKQAPVAVQQCFGAADARDPSRILMGVSNPGASNCRFSDKRESAGHTDFAVFCEGLFAIAGRGSVDFTPNSLRGDLNMNFVSGTPGDTQRVNAVSRITGKRIGSC